MADLPFVGWMYDIAREQAPSPALLDRLARRSKEAGYDAMGVYLEHRYAYPSAPWAADRGCLTPEMAGELVARARELSLRIIPFLNTLGHMEGFIRSRGGHHLAEGPATSSQQICPSRPECGEFARQLVCDVLDVFDDEWVHLGGDETFQLGQCPLCEKRVEADGKAAVYGEYFGPLCHWILEQGRRPCLWGDMLIQHPEALEALPKETLIFDWQYFSRPKESTAMFRERGFDVVCCPSVQSYNSGWCFLGASQENIDQHCEDAVELGGHGVLLTTWEFYNFGQYETVLPLIFAAARRLRSDANWAEALKQESNGDYLKAAEILGNEIPELSPFLEVGTWRQLKDRFIIRQNPFYLWEDWRDEACAEIGDRILELCDQVQALPDAAVLHFPALFHRTAIEWVRQIEKAFRAYEEGTFSQAAALIEESAGLLEPLRPALWTASQEGGSRGDLSRLDRLTEKIGFVAERVREVQNETEAGEPWVPDFRTLYHDAYLAGDQAAWRTGFYR